MARSLNGRVAGPGPASPGPGARQGLLSAGLNEWLVNALAGLYQDYRHSGTDGYAAQVTGTVERLTGRPARSLDDLLGEMAPTHPPGSLGWATAS